MHLFLEGADEIEVVVRDVVVVVLDLREGLFVRLHETFDVRVFPLLYSRSLRLARYVQSFPHLQCRVSW